jgi:hypothetical protein
MSSDALTTIDQANSGTRSSVIPGARRVRTVVATQMEPSTRATAISPNDTRNRSTAIELPPPGPPLAM